MKQPKTYSVPVVDLETFRNMVLDHLVHDMERYSHREICESFIGRGVLAFNKDNLGEFMKSLSGSVFLPPVVVDIGDSMFHWLVCGTSAILVHKDVQFHKKSS